MSLFNVELPDNTAICPQCGVKYDIYGFHSCGSIDEAVKKALAIRDTEWKLEYGKLVEQARKELAARDKWWIDRVGEDIVEIFLNFPMNDANKETLLKTWQRLKKESEEK